MANFELTGMRSRNWQKRSEFSALERMEQRKRQETLRSSRSGLERDTLTWVDVFHVFEDLVDVLGREGLEDVLLEGGVVVHVVDEAKHGLDERVNVVIGCLANGEHE